MDHLWARANEQYCYLTTTGRRSGTPHTVEMWFAVPADGSVVYMLAGGREKADWMQNIGRNPGVEVRLGDVLMVGHGRLVTHPAEDALARHLLVRKYYGRETVAAAGWEAEALCMAIDL